MMETPADVLVAPAFATLRIRDSMAAHCNRLAVKPESAETETVGGAMARVRYLDKDVDAALPFYAALGFAQKERWGPPFAILQKSDLQLWLSGPGSSASRRLADGSVPTPGGWNRLVIEVQNIAEAMSALRSTGARFRSDPIDGPGGQQVLVEDPSGNPIELFQPQTES